MDLAKRMIDTAKACGADAVKFQSWDTTIFSRKVYEDNYFLGDDYRARNDYTLKEIVEAFAVGPEGMAELNDYRSEEHTSELQSLMRISYAVFCLNKKKH